MTDKRYSKVEEEIIQILDQMDDDPKPEQPANLVQFRPRPRPKREVPGKSQIRQVQQAGILQRVRRYSAGSWVGVGIVAAIMAWQLSRFVNALALIAMVISIGAFMAALYTRKSGSVAGIPSSSSTTKRWRGRDIDLSQPRSTGGSLRKPNWRGRFRGPRT